jgi:predicted nucleic acid-binding protein
MASALLERVETMAITDSVLSEAAALHPPGLRILDAIHLASALRFGQSIGVLVSYDVRMVAAGGPLGLLVASPGA